MSAAGVDLTCPKREDGGPHVWSSPLVDAERPCVHCGRKGREEEKPGEPNNGFFAQATAARAELFSRLQQPASVKAWGAKK